MKKDMRLAEATRWIVNISFVLCFFKMLQTNQLSSALLFFYLIFCSQTLEFWEKTDFSYQPSELMWLIVNGLCGVMLMMYYFFGKQPSASRGFLTLIVCVFTIVNCISAGRRKKQSDSEQSI